MTRTPQTLIALILILTLAGCEETFAPYAESDYLYAISGYLNAAADTQWIRIMPMRQAVAYTSKEPLDATVTLERLSDGRTVTLRDSSFTHIPTPFLEVADTTFSHTFWTTEPILKGKRYRLTVTRSDGASAISIVTIPTDFEVTLEYPTDYPVRPYVVEVTDVNLALVLLRARAHCPAGSLQEYMMDLPNPVPDPVNGVYRVPVRDPPSKLLDCVIPPMKLVVAVSDIPWPEGSWNLGWSFPDLHSASNLTHAAGLFAGILTEEPPFGHPCYLDPPTGPCRITMTDESGSIAGYIIDQQCLTSVQDVMVELREIPPTQGSPAQTRKKTEGSPGYTFPALEPERRYILTASHPLLRLIAPPYTQVYDSRVDTVFVGAGQNIRHDLLLPRRVPCGAPTTTQPL